MSDERRQGPPSGIGDGRPVQAGCGAIIGALIGVGEIGVIGWGRGSVLGLTVAIGIPAAIAALLAWQYGDRFWETYFGGD